MRLRPSALLFCLLLHRAQAQRPALAPRGRAPTEPPNRELRESEPTARTSSLSDVAALLASSPSEWYDYLTRVSESLEDAVETVSDSTSNFMFRDILGYRVGWARTRRLALLLSRSRQQELGQVPILSNLFQNLQARSACENFEEICSRA